MTPGPAPAPGIGRGGDALKKVQTGDALRIPAQAYNAFIDAARDFRGRTASVGQRPMPAPPTETIRVRNDSGIAVGRFAVLGINGPLIDPTSNLREFANRLGVAGVAPTKADHAGRFVITAEPLAPGAIGGARVAGASIARIDMQADGDRWAEVADSAAVPLRSGDAGSARILWAEPGTGVKWAVVLLACPSSAPPNDEVRAGKITEMYDASGTVIPSPSITAGMGYPVYAQVATDAEGGSQYVALRFAIENVPNWGRHFEYGDGLYFVSVSGLIWGNPVDFGHATVPGRGAVTGFRILPETPPQAHQTFAVQVVQTGGQDAGPSGNGTVWATWTYDLYQLGGGGDPLGTGLGPTKTRSPGRMVPGDGVGLAYYDENGAIQLWDAGERPTTALCDA